MICWGCWTKAWTGAIFDFWTVYTSKAAWRRVPWSLILLEAADDQSMVVTRSVQQVTGLSHTSKMSAGQSIHQDISNELHQIRGQHRGRTGLSKAANHRLRPSLHLEMHPALQQQSKF